MNVISVIMILLAAIISLIYAVSNGYVKRLNKRKLSKKEIQEIKKNVGVSNKGETLDKTHFYYVPYNKIGV